MGVLSSQVERGSDAFTRRHERMTALVEELRERTALVAARRRRAQLSSVIAAAGS